MRYNPDTERGLRIEDIAAQCRPLSNAPSPYPQPDQVWDCRNGGWIPNRLKAEADTASKQEPIDEATVQLWAVAHKLRQIAPGTVAPATIASLKRDVFEIIHELQRLS